MVPVIVASLLAIRSVVLSQVSDSDLERQVQQLQVQEREAAEKAETRRKAEHQRAEEERNARETAERMAQQKRDAAEAEGRREREAEEAHRKAILDARIETDARRARYNEEVKAARARRTSGWLIASIGGGLGLAGVITFAELGSASNASVHGGGYANAAAIDSQVSTGVTDNGLAIGFGVAAVTAVTIGLLDVLLSPDPKSDMSLSVGIRLDDQKGVALVGRF